MQSCVAAAPQLGPPTQFLITEEETQTAKGKSPVSYRVSNPVSRWFQFLKTQDSIFSHPISWKQRDFSDHQPHVHNLGGEMRVHHRGSLKLWAEKGVPLFLKRIIFLPHGKNGPGRCTDGLSLLRAPHVFLLLLSWFSLGSDDSEAAELGSHWRGAACVPAGVRLPGFRASRSSWFLGALTTGTTVRGWELAAFTAFIHKHRFRYAFCRAD